VSNAQHQFVEIGLQDEKYAIRIEAIQEIIKMQPITDIPGSRDEVQGVINLRGKIVPIVGMRKRFGLQEAGESAPSTRIVVVNAGTDAVGFIVDRVHRVASYDRIQPPPQSRGGIDASCVAAVGYSDRDVVSILNLDAVLRQGGAV